MDVTKKCFSVLSSDNTHRLSGIVYIPDVTPKAYLHVVHGMTEHIGRYDRFMTDMASEGYICFGYDALGHGNTAKNDDELGGLLNDLYEIDPGVQFHLALLTTRFTSRRQRKKHKNRNS